MKSNVQGYPLGRKVDILAPEGIRGNLGLNVKSQDLLFIETTGFSMWPTRVL